MNEWGWLALGMVVAAVVWLGWEATHPGDFDEEQELRRTGKND